MDKTGSLVIDNQYDGAGEFSEGLAMVELNGKWGYINNKNEMVIEPKFDFTNGFKEGRAFVKINDKWGCINKSGDMLIKPQFEHVLKFQNGLASVLVNPFMRIYIYRDGNKVWTPKNFI